MHYLGPAPGLRGRSFYIYSMKYRFLFLLLSLLPLSLVAAPVPADKAGRLAQQFLRAEGSRSSTVKLLEEPYSTKSMSGDPGYYIFEGDRGGFVLMASDDRVSPVIGWSADGKFKTEGMPENLRAWLDMWHDIIQAVQAGKVAPQAGAAAEWEAIEKDVKPLYAAGKELATANWSQGNPYNAYCPAYEDGTSVTGCTATATAIVMRYHKWPEAGTGTIPAYTYTDKNGTERKVGAVKLGHAYKWDNMPLNVSTSTDAGAQDEIARLIYEVGVMLKSRYNPDGTSAYTLDIAYGLTTYFDYDGTVFNFEKKYFNDAEWIQMMIDNIDNVGPVIYSGQSKDGGHAFVVDGYNAQGQFRINWGWGGSDNGYYTFPAFGEFTTDHGVCVNVRKNMGGPVQEGLFIDGNDVKETGGLKCATTEFKVGEPFDLTCKYIFNINARPFKGQIALAVMHRDGSIGEILGVLENVYLGRLSGTSLNATGCVLEEPIQIGDRLCLWYSSDLTPEWTPIRANIEEGYVGEIPIADTQSIEEVTSFRYAAATGVLVISSKNGISWTIKDKHGVSYTQGVEYADGVLTIDTNEFKQDSYILTLTKDYDSKSVEFVFGKK